MSYKFLLIAFCFSIGGCGETIDARQLEIDNGLFYKKGENSPFTGLAENFPPKYENGVRFAKISPKRIDRCYAHFKNGMFHGTLECFSDENRVAIIDFENGNKNGREAIWDAASGNLLYEVEFKKNIKHGNETTYDEFGKNLVGKAVFSQGNMVSQKEWNSSGELTLNLTNSDKGLTGFSVNNSGTVIYYSAEKDIIVKKHFMFKEGFNRPAWSKEMRYFGDMRGVYISSITIDSQKGDQKSIDFYDENGSLSDAETPQYKIKFGLDDGYISSLNPKLFK